jgi:hypothetical protein
LRNMEYMVYCRMSWKIQAIGHHAHPCQDVEGAEEAKGQLLVGAGSKRGLDIRLCWYILTHTEKIRKRTDTAVAFTRRF